MRTTKTQDTSRAYEDFLVKNPGKFPKKVARNSHFEKPIDTGKELRGNTRRWGDASPVVQRSVINEIIHTAKAKGLACRETALALAIARIESGFNPDAAAGSTSASGIGQFIDRTASAYGISESQRFDMKSGARALIEHLRDNLNSIPASLSFRDRAELAYALHHDGPTLKYGGLTIARDKVMPWFERIRKSLTPTC